MRVERGRMQPSVRVTCGRCDHSVTSFGTGPKSISRCLMLLKEQCPEGETNFYVTE
jgi:hypothetical protein